MTTIRRIATRGVVVRGSALLCAVIAAGCGGTEAPAERAASASSAAAARACEWSAPVKIPEVNAGKVNSEVNENNPSLSADGRTLYFVRGGNTIWVSRWDEGARAWGDPAQPLYFGREEEDRVFRIFAAPTDRHGNVLANAKRVEELSPAGGASGLGPSLRMDRREIFFHSGRAGTLGGNDLWTSTRRNVHEPWSAPENVGAPINTAAGEAQPNLSRDGRTLFFVTAREAGRGSDIYMSTRSPPSVE